MGVRQPLPITPVREHHGGSRAELEAELAEEGGPEIGFYHSYEITGAVDGPGVRFTLFLPVARSVASTARTPTPGPSATAAASHHLNVV